MDPWLTQHIKQLGEPKSEQARAIWRQALALCKQGNEEDDDAKIQKSISMRLLVRQLEPDFQGAQISMHDWIRLFD